MRAAVRLTLQKGAAHLLRAGIDAVQVMKTHGPTQIQFWFIALAIGIAAGGAAVLFRLGISVIQSAVYGTHDVLMLHTLAASLAWYHVLVVPICGGLIVGVVLHRFTDDGRVR